MILKLFLFVLFTGAYMNDEWINKWCWPWNIYEDLDRKADRSVYIFSIWGVKKQAHMGVVCPSFAAWDIAGQLTVPRAILPGLCDTLTVNIKDAQNV